MLFFLQITFLVGNAEIELPGSTYPSEWPRLRDSCYPPPLPSSDPNPGEWSTKCELVRKRLESLLDNGNGDDKSPLVYECCVLPHFGLTAYVFALDADDRPIEVDEEFRAQGKSDVKRPPSTGSYYAVTVHNYYMNPDFHYNYGFMSSSLLRQMDKLGYSSGMLVSTNELDDTDGTDKIDEMLLGGLFLAGRLKVA